MFSLNEYAHIPFLKKELNQLIPKGSFASYMWSSIGGEIHGTLVESPFEDEVEFSSIFPAEYLFLWIMRDGGLDINWLTDGGEIFIDNNGKLVPESVDRSYTGAEQMAAYGLWLLTSEFNTMGPMPEDGVEFNDHGFRRHQIVEHDSECMLQAYQSLVYGHRLRGSYDLREDERNKAEKMDFSTLGKRGAAKRHEPMRELERIAVELYRERQWKSANQAAHQLKEKIIAHGRSIGAVLSEENAQRTIAGWLRKCPPSG